MEKKYKQWIKEKYPTKESALNKCGVAVEEMASFFLELEIQVGFANKKQHCWLKTLSNEIIDPTEKQFNKPIKYYFIANHFLKK